MGCLAVIETHPIQYHAPVYRMLEQKFNIPVTAIYGSDFSVAGYYDTEFNATFAWDTDLLSGYSSIFLSRVREDGARSSEHVSTQGLEKALRNIKPNAIIILVYSPRFHQMAFYMAWRACYPIIFRGETRDPAHKQSFLKAWLRDQALSWMYQKCSRLLYIGQRSLQHFNRLGCPKRKLIFSPYCVDTTVFQCSDKLRVHLRSNIRKELGIRESDIALLFSGKLNPRKRPDLLLAAIKKLLPDMREQITLIFLGNGKLKNNLEDFAKKQPLIKTHFVGFKNQSEMSPYYHAADLLILPSHSDPWGLVINEALHHGLPCVVSEAVGCMPDLIEPGLTGEVFQTDSISSLVASIQRGLKLVVDPGIRQKCRKKVNGYTVEKAALGIKEAYQAVANKNG